MRAGGAHGERVAIGIRPRRDLGADGAACTAAIINHHLLAEFFAELLSHQTRDDVGGTARGKRHDEADRLGWIIILRAHRAAHQHQRGSDNTMQVFVFK